MGCNTSKESIQQAVEEAKEDVKETTKDIAREVKEDVQEMAKDITRNLIKEETKEEAKNGDVPKSAETTAEGEKVTSAKSTKSITEEENKEEDSKEQEDEAKELDSEEQDSTERSKEEEAATRIQAVFRGHNVRKSMKETDSTTKQGQNADTEPTKEELEQEFREDDKELCQAATKIQATFRGHMSRKVDQAATAAKDLVQNAAEKIEEKVTDAVNELEGIDLSDPDLHKAATKIQASFRGHKVRQEVTIPGEEKK